MACDSVGSCGSFDEAPVTGFPQVGSLIVARIGEPPGPGFPVQIVAAVVRDHDLLPEPVVAVGPAALSFATPDADQGQQRQQGVIQVGAFAQVGGVGGDGQIVEDRDVAGRGQLGAFGGCGHGTIRGTGRTGRLVTGVSAGGHARSRLVGDQPIQRVQREPGDHHDRRDQDDLEEQNHGNEFSRR